METLIMGMLMLKKMTLYEMRKHFEQNFTSMSSSSMGSIQAAMKKLHQRGMVRFDEYVENGVNKKRYEITTSGRDHFLATISTPMIHKERSMELAKLFFMGMVETSKRPELLTAYIEELGKELAFLHGVKQRVGAMSGTDDAYRAQIPENAAGQSFSVNELRDIALYQVAMLELAITKIQAELEWFEGFSTRLGAEQ